MFTRIDMTRNDDRFLLGLLLGFYELCFSIALIPSHKTRQLFSHQTVLLGCLLQSEIYILRKTTTGTSSGDIAVGSILSIQLLIALDGIFFTDPNQLKDRHESPSRGQNITDQPLTERIQWTFKMYTNPRGIGWEHEPSDLPDRPSSSTSRGKFLLDRLLAIILGIMSGYLVSILNASNPGLTTPNRKLSESQWIWRVMTVVGLGIGAGSIMNTIHAVMSVMAVGFGLSKPERWPNLFGSPLEAWNLQGAWRKVWHQMVRKPLLGATRFILVDILGLPPLSHKTNNIILDTGNKLLWLYIPFLISGAVHMGGEYMLLGKMGYGALTFFFLQAVGITIEKLVAFLWGRLRPGPSRRPQDSRNGLKNENHHLSRRVGAPIWVRCIGHIYVIIWFAWSLAFYVDAMVNTDIFVCPRCDLKVTMNALTYDDWLS